jgi:hypothetical protein
VHVRKRQSFDQDQAERAAELERSNSELARFAFLASHDLHELRATEFIGFAVDARVWVGPADGGCSVLRLTRRASRSTNEEGRA